MPAARRLVSAAAALVLAGGLTACESVGLDKAPEPTCPDLRIDRDTARMTVFDGSGQDLTDILFEAQIADVVGDCAFEEADEGPGGTVTAEFNVLFAITRGPAFSGRDGHFTYFVALPGYYPRPEAKQTLPVDFRFPENNTPTIQVRDELIQLAIPVDSPKAAAGVPVYIGFQLTPEQLEYNRAGRR